MKNYSDMVIIDAKLAGQWIDLPAPNTVNDTVNVHLRPGSMTLKQDNSNQTFKRASDIFENGTVSLLINADENGFAKGRIYLDDGITLSSLAEKKYEYYEFVLAKNTIRKQVLNEVLTEPVGTMLKDVIIFNAVKELGRTFFACATNIFDGSV